VEARRERLVMLQSLNNGKPRAEAHLDVDDVIATFSYYAQLAEQLDHTSSAEVSIPSVEHRARILREPSGVAALIVPWNFPMVTTAWKLAPAASAGASFHAVVTIGKFHGTISAATPEGSRRIRARCSTLGMLTSALLV
jgi:betaine-aldehyde dehydrogenase